MATLKIDETKSDSVIKKYFNIMRLNIFLTFVLLFLAGSKAVTAQCPAYSYTTTHLGGGLYSFTLTQTNGTNGTFVSGSWYFGDGSPVYQSSSMTVQHQYSTAGNYAVSFAYTATYTVTSETGGTTEQTCSSKWGGPAIQYSGVECPKLVFMPFSNSCGEGEVNIQIAECNSTGAQLQQVSWDMGDGSAPIVTNDLNMDYTYAASSIYSVYATATYILPNGQTCSVQVKKPNLSNPDPLSNYCQDTYVADHMQVPIIIFNGFITFAAPNTAPNAGTPASIVLNYTGSVPSSSPYTIYLDGVVLQSGTGIPASGGILYTANLPEGQHLLEIVISSPERSCSIHLEKWIEVLPPPPPPCNDCITFSPEIGKRYWVSAWAKEEMVSQVLNYPDAALQIEFIGSTGAPVTFHTTGDIIEGWQRIIGDFVIPTGTTSISINLLNSNGTVFAYFDDIRIHPFNASMKSYVYDPVTFLLTAELDDNNYATFYEYDKEGQLIRIKKETARGVMTIQESHSNNPKKP